MNKIITSTMRALILLVVVMLGASALHPTGAYAFLSGSSVRVQQEGGGGGSAGGTYTNTNVVIPEMTTASGNDVTTDVIPTDPSGLSTYRQSFQVNKTLWRTYNRHASGCASAGCVPQSDTSIQGYIAGLQSPNITIGYSIGVYNASTNAPYPQNSNIPVGTQIKLLFGQYLSNNIYWYGTGYSADSPYGEWRTAAAAPARSANRPVCDSKDYIQKVNVSGVGNYGVYIPLVVNPPARDITVIPSNLTCGAITNNADGTVSMLCTVNAAGPIVPRFHFDSTYGKFYFRYTDGSTCWGNNMPMSDALGNVSGPSYRSTSSISAPYQLDVPAADIDYTLNGVAPSDPPSVPTMSCASSGTTGQALSFTVSATDPQNDTIRYGLDWTNAGTVNEWNPATGYVSSGTGATISHTWNAAGTYTVRALAEDSNGNQSTWASCPVTITSAPPVISCNASPSTVIPNQLVNFTSNISGGSGNFTYSWSDADGIFSTLVNASKSFSSTGTKTVTLTVTDNGAAPTATLSASPDSIPSGYSSTLTWNSTDSTSCTGTGFSTGGATSGSATVTPSSTTTYSLSCTGSGGTVNQTATVTVSASAAACGEIASPVSIDCVAAEPIDAQCSATQVVTYDTVPSKKSCAPQNSYNHTAYWAHCTASASCNAPATPTTSLSAAPTSVGSGGASTLTWSSANATSCTGTNFSTGSATSGTATVNPLSTTAYSVSCTGTGGSASANATVTVVSAPTATLTASPTSVVTGGSSTLSWSSTNATSCTGTGFSTGNAASGSATVTPGATTTYTLTCTGAAGSVSKSATVTVTAGGGGGGGGCFAGDTLIEMADGSAKPINQVAVGDEVLGQGADGTRRPQTVTQLFVHDGSYAVLRVNGSLIVTPNHPIWVLRGGKGSWMAAGDIRVGDLLVGLGTIVPVLSVEPAGTLPTVLNLEVVPDHTYFAGGMLVHNKLNNSVQN